MCSAIGHVRLTPESDIKCDITKCRLRAKANHGRTRLVCGLIASSCSDGLVTTSGSSLAAWVDDSLNVFAYDRWLRFGRQIGVRIVERGRQLRYSQDGRFATRHQKKSPGGKGSLSRGGPGKVKQKLSA